ncbi:MAG: cupin domain-containing protein [Bacteroidota bacterium]|nr:cupin domain-containing protein [Bacteroidota bacterium]
MIITKKLADTKIMETAHNVDARNLYNTDDAMVTVVTLSAGQSLKKHITPVDVAFYVLEGEGKILVGEETEMVTKNTLIESPKDIVHYRYNESASDLRFMVIKAPKPTRKSVFIS